MVSHIAMMAALNAYGHLEFMAEVRSYGLQEAFRRRLAGFI